LTLVALHTPRVAALQARRKYRSPDALGSPSRELAQLVDGYGKVRGARALGPHLDPTRCRSPSLHAFVRGVLRVAGGGPP
jgi:hypothetical protein